MEPAELSAVLKRFYIEARKVEGNPYSCNIMKVICSRLDRFLSGSPQGKPFCVFRGKAFKPANEALDASLKDLARQGLISSTKHKGPISNFQWRPWSGLKYFVLRERATKNQPGGVSHNEDESQSVMMAWPGNPRCPVACLEKYLAKRDPRWDALSKTIAGRVNC